MKPGDKFDRYAILRRIGRGGMGDVYRAHDTRLHRSVALKILRPDALEDGSEKSRAEAVERMFREARAAAALEHPNVVVIHDVGEVTIEGGSEPSYFIAMEYVDGAVLRSLIGKTDPPIAERIRWLLDVARALDFAHEHGIIHRDVKPENIILRNDGVVKVLDFGIARRTRSAQAGLGVDPLSALTEKGVALGTPRYMAPEQMLGEELDGRADQYAWALTAYELLAGVAPWPGAPDSLQLVAQSLIRNAEPLRSRVPDVPEIVGEVVDRALSRERADRFPTMAFAIEALSDWGTPAASRRSLTTVRTSKKEPVVEAPPSGPPSVAPPEIEADAAPVPELTTLQGHHSTRRAYVVKRPARWPAFVAMAAAGVLAIAAGAWLLRPQASAPPPAPIASSPPPACVSSAQCTKERGAPAICRPAGPGCVTLASEDCRVESEPDDPSNDATEWVGALFPLTGPDAKAFGTREFQAVDLARRDFAHMLAGSTARPHGGHPIALLACDDAADPHRAAHHLVDEVGVPAVIGFRSSDEAIDLATSTLIPKGVLGIAALNTSPMISSLPRAADAPRMVWRTTYSAAEMALPIAHLVPEVLEPELRPALKREPLRVALVRQDDATGLGFADTLFRALKFNDRSALDNESRYRELVGALGAGDPLGELDSLIAKLTAFAPHVVVYFGSDESLVRIAEHLEHNLHGPVAPRYVKTSTFGPVVHAFLGTNAERRRRFWSLTTVSTTAANARFVARYNEAFSDTVTRTFSPNSSYDAFYVIAFATYALGDAPVSGTALANAIPRLTPPGPAIDVGPTGIFDAINRLAAGGRVDLNGATGPLDFDPETGDARVDLAVLCADVDAHGMAVDDRESGLVYDATTGALRGTMHCP